LSTENNKNATDSILLGIGCLHSSQKLANFGYGFINYQANMGTIELLREANDAQKSLR